MYTFYEAFDELNETNEQAQAMNCPYCKSNNTKLVKEEEDADPYTEDQYTGTEHTIYKGYKCKDCSCEFAYIHKDISYSGIEIEEDGVDYTEVNIDLPDDWYENDSDLYDEDEDGYREYNELFDKLVSDFKSICIEAGCKYVYADSNEIRLEGPINIIRKLIKSGEDTDNDILHTLYYVYDDYVDDELPSRIDYSYDEMNPKVYW